MAAHVNGDVPTAEANSAFIQHLLKYPVINDGVTTFKENPYGQKSLQLSDSAYKTFAKPVLPYFSRPYQYVSPYVKKADSIGDETLSKIDEKFPVVTKPTGELYSNAKGLILMPVRKGFEGKDHFVKTYTDEYKKDEKPGIMTYGKALVSTAFIIGHETLSWVGGFLSSKKAEVKNTTANN